MPKPLRARPPADPREARQVHRLAGARHAPADWIRRAKTIALSWSGMRVPAIAAVLDCSEKAVRYRIERFNAEGLAGLTDRPGAGRKRRITDAERCRILALLRQTPPAPRSDSANRGADGPGAWTLNALTAAARREGIDIQRSQVRRILLAEGICWVPDQCWVSRRR